MPYLVSPDGIYYVNFIDTEKNKVIHPSLKFLSAHSYILYKFALSRDHELELLYLLLHIANINKTHNVPKPIDSHFSLISLALNKHISSIITDLNSRQPEGPVFFLLLYEL